MSDSNTILDTSHLFWIGGSPCGGKSTVAERISKEYGLRLYRIDDQIDRLLKTITTSQQPALSLWQRQTWEQRWMQPVDQQLALVNQAYDETFQFCLEEIKSFPTSQPVLIEGNPLRPKNIKPYLFGPHHAIWLIARADDLVQFYRQRQWAQEIVNQCSNPKEAFDNWMQRDISFARQIKAECEVDNLTYIMSDPKQSLNEKADQVAAHFQLLCDL